MKKLLFMAALTLLAACLWGQSNEMLDEFLGKDVADVATSLLLVAQAAGELPVDAAPQDGYRWGQDQEFAKHVEKKDPGDPMTLGLFYLALLKSFGVKGGIWFNTVGSPRYAALEAGYLGYVEPSKVYPTRALRPYEVLTGITYVTADAEGGQQ